MGSLNMSACHLVYVMPGNLSASNVFGTLGMTWKEILADLEDIILIGNSFRDHLSNLTKVNDGLRLKKCELFLKDWMFSCESWSAIKESH